MTVVLAELTKLRSVASTAWSLLSAVCLIVGFGILYSTARASHPPAAGSTFDAVAVSLAGVQAAHLAVGVLGVLVVTNEYANGLIRTTLAAVPRRTPVLWGKAAVLGCVTFAVSLPAVLAAFLAGQSVLAAEHLDTSLTEPGVARAVVGGAGYLALVALLGLGLGTVVRHTAGGIAAVFGVLLGPQMLTGLLPTGLADDVYGWLPSPAGLAVTTVRPDSALLPPWAGAAVFSLYIAIAMCAGAWCLRRRDA
ncbi:ABC transporter permease [Amorphoplanes digitatis]|uniref:ABC-type transport system involved in multi-copper enzyme maturation permease subunit n=1 Tax=Actinoplanes digitatis TaxID=1868 RepID=A0A7W7HTS1_9ACTN|nr:ABC transporter permease [Actinoplanes digitatis]MBB4760635.1 ABC-type transport system involved in multi-copper enzyme maturation permease subunit [Actinoplanes digitatis]GID94343.1 ABC transporter permease [Actinoplanes digitatis]